jgi:phosphoglycolate phosphatase
MTQVQFKGHIVFDCDGTLISSSQMVLETVAAILSDFFNKKISILEVKKKFDPNIEKFYASFGITSATDQAKIQDRWMLAMNSTPRKYQLFDGITELLTFLKQQQFALYVWTARDKESTVALLTDLKVMHFFSDLRSGTCTPIKPHPQGLQEMVGSIDPQQVFHIGDSYTDIVGAKAIRCRSIGVLWCDHANMKALKEQGADYLANHPHEVREIISHYFQLTS